MSARYMGRLACELSDLDPDRLNSWISLGYFACAPETRPGKARSFDENGVVSLKILSQLLTWGVSEKHACRLAYEALDYIANRPLTELLHYVQEPGAAAAISHWTDTPQDKSAPGFASMLTFNVEVIRKDIREKFWGVSEEAR